MVNGIRIYGITGGMGSGKSTVLKQFAARGFPTIDADKVGHEIIAPGGAAEAAVKEAFGPEILTGDTIDREKLGALVFRRKDARERLNAIVHPAIRAEIQRRAANLAREGYAVVLVEAALFGESGTLQPWMDGLILVLSPREERIKRIMISRRLTRPQAEARLDAQMPPENKRPLATWVIENNRGLKELRDSVDKIAEVIHG